MTNLVHVNNLGNEFDLGNIEPSKIHIKVDGTTIKRDPTTGTLAVDSSAVAGAHLTGVTYTPDTANPAASIPLNFNMSNSVQHQLNLTSVQDAFGVLLGYMFAA